MDGWTIGSDVATMLTGLSAVTAAATWLISRYRSWRQERDRTRARNWHGFIMTNGISDWYVRLVDDPNTPTAVVPLEVINRNGEPDPQMAYGLHNTVISDGMLARVPTEQEFAFLKYLHKELGYGKGTVVR
jgi:hypothetical protein